MVKPAALDDLTTLPALAPEFELSLKAARRSPRTVQSYLEAVRFFDEFLTTNGMPRQIASIEREHVDAWIADLLETRSSATAAVRYRSLQAFFKWAVAEEEITVNPMRNTRPPTIEEKPIDVVSDTQMRALLKAVECSNPTFDDRRDAALFRLFYDTGCRLSEITNLTLEDLDLEANCIAVVRKGSRAGFAPFGLKTRKALRLYLRERSSHQLAELQWLWLGSRGKQLTQSGVAQMLRRRCKQAELPPLHPHQFRHTTAHNLKREGHSDEEVMRLLGWRSREMLARYGSALADERAHESYRRKGAPGDRL